MIQATQFGKYTPNGNRTRYLSGLLDEPYSDAVGNRTTKLDSLGYCSEPLYHRNFSQIKYHTI